MSENGASQYRAGDALLRILPLPKGHEGWSIANACILLDVVANVGTQLLPRPTDRRTTSQPLPLRSAPVVVMCRWTRLPPAHRSSGNAIARWLRQPGIAAAPQSGHWCESSDMARRSRIIRRRALRRTTVVGPVPRSLRLRTRAASTGTIGHPSTGHESRSISAPRASFRTTHGSR